MRSRPLLPSRVARWLAAAALAPAALGAAVAAADQQVVVRWSHPQPSTVEGFRMRDRPVLSVQYHPEASPGPHDSHYLFEEFVSMMRAHRGA